MKAVNSYYRINVACVLVGWFICWSQVQTLANAEFITEC